MQGILGIGFYVALAGIVVVLALGIINLVRQDGNQPSRSNKLMRLRVIFQGVAILLLVLVGVAAGAIKFGG
ncbi:MAG: twin transmembrane helix small protein [Hyphomonas sp.]|jgi:hypothetical protein|uniref:twin transmembrane helix small protein n=1 Tax=Hyphomonas sp. TaxID=87 RepID=UPI0017D6E8DB|nr:twin transmembrane helix small protein [Hyphomonas sp.]MBU3920623.1 twin transmembrane helix small protein [Alphaproteobacteria bacterium]MBA3068993.1 twin transmembrane helix small protein [Hyphomonas sp.]MBU4061626.1 twin transmembrane helix small protein [Alphaproteobacteria bacterium]MBU4163471.1 twin transmembrane helix small protein [Alphaproteobacteria bacterium]MBU4567415.1 twin transmembrane helix small protein [Alphaproteobacteria bacterium]